MSARPAKKNRVSCFGKSFASLQRGVTLIELVISIVILSLALVAVLNGFSRSIEHSADPLWRNKTLKLAQLYLDEILSKNYDHNTPVGGVPVVSSPGCSTMGPEAGETRATFNDVDDYHNYGLTNPADAVPSSLVAPLDSSYSQYRVTVSVQCDGASVNASANNQAKKITVTITPPEQSAMSFSVYRGNF